MKSSKIPRKFQLSINFLDQKRPSFLSLKSPKQELSILKSMVFHAEENIILHQLFESKEDRISHLRKVQNKNFPII